MEGLGVDKSYRCMRVESTGPMVVRKRSGFFLTSRSGEYYFPAKAHRPVLSYRLSIIQFLGAGISIHYGLVRITCFIRRCGLGAISRHGLSLMLMRSRGRQLKACFCAAGIKCAGTVLKFMVVAVTATAWRRWKARCFPSKNGELAVALTDWTIAHVQPARSAGMGS